MRWASNGTDAWGLQAAITSGPKVRFGTNRPSITSHWMRSTPASSRAATSSPSRAKSAGSTEGAISIGRITDDDTPARTLLPVTIVRLRATSVAAGGDAVARDDEGRVVFVTGALPGELVVVALDDERARFARGHVVEVEEASAARVEPPCEFVAQGCGGCTWQHIDPTA